MNGKKENDLKISMMLEMGWREAGNNDVECLICEEVTENIYEKKNEKEKREAVDIQKISSNYIK